MIALPLDMLLQHADQLFGRRFRNDRPRLGAHVAGRHVADVERRVLQCLLIVLVGLSRLSDAQPLAQRRFIIGDGGHDPLRRRVDLHGVVIAGDCDPTVLVLHGRPQLRKPHRRVGRIVAEMAAVQALLGTEDRQGRLGDAAVAEHQRRLVGLVHRAAQHRQRVILQQLGILPDDLAQRRRPPSPLGNRG